MNSAVSTVEWGYVAGSPSIQSSVVHGGLYAAEISNLVSGTSQQFLNQFYAANSSGPVFARAYFYFITFPSSNNTIMKFNDQAFTENYYIQLTSSGTVGLFNQSFSQVGSYSSAIPSGQWCYIELKFDAAHTAGSQTLEARLNGTVFATSGAQTLSANISEFNVGGNLFSETQTQGLWYIDDVAINDSTGAYQTSYPGAGYIVHLRPNAIGDNNSFAVQVGGTAGSTNNYTRVNEITPDDAISYNGDTVSGHVDDFQLTDSPPSIQTYDTINVVSIGVTYSASVASAESPFVVRCKSQPGGSVSESSIITPNTTSWNTNNNAPPYNYPLTLYAQPGTAISWTQPSLNTAQAGYRITSTGTNATYVTTVWMLVESVPSNILSTGFVTSPGVKVIDYVGVY